jgi:hypothetical protein
MPDGNIRSHKPALTYGKQPIIQMIELGTDDLNYNQLACYFKGQSIPIKRFTDSKIQITFTLPEPLKPGRSRVNCTAPSIQYRGRYYWGSYPWFMPTAEGKWLE